MQTTAFVVIIYGVFLIIGGLIGYVKAQSTMSLVMSSFFALLCLISAAALMKSRVWGVYLALATLLFMSGFFMCRYSVNPKLMPSGIMLAASLICLVVVFVQQRARLF